MSHALNAHPADILSRVQITLLSLNHLAISKYKLPCLRVVFMNYPSAFSIATVHRADVFGYGQLVRSSQLRVNFDFEGNFVHLHQMTEYSILDG